MRASMDGTRAACIAFLAIAELGGGCSGKKAAPPPSREAPTAPTAQAAGAQDAGDPVPGPTDAAPTAAAAAAAAAEPPDPIESLFRRRYTPDDSLPERMQRRIRYHLRDQTKAAIALHHITYIPQAGAGGGDVFAIYEYSVQEDCILQHKNRKEGREQCTSAPEYISDTSAPFVQDKPADQQVFLNQECLKLGVVRAHFEPPGPDVPVDAGGALTLWSAKLDGLCEVRDFNRLFVADLDGDERLEMYLEITTAEEILNREPPVRSGHEIVTVGHHFQRNLYLFAGDGARDFALPLELGAWEDIKLPPQEAVELRDLNHDRRLDVIQRELCVTVDTDKNAVTDRTCSGRPRWKAEWLYDTQKDGWFRKPDLNDDAKAPAEGSAKEPASGSAKEPTGDHAKEPATGSAKELAKEPATGSAKEPATGGAKEPASSSAKEPATGGTKGPASSGAKEPATGSAKEPASSSAKEPATGGTKESAGGAKEPAGGGATKGSASSGAKEPASSGAKTPAVGGAAPP